MNLVCHGSYWLRASCTTLTYAFRIVPGPPTWPCSQAFQAVHLRYAYYTQRYTPSQENKDNQLNRAIGSHSSRATDTVSPGSYAVPQPQPAFCLDSYICGKHSITRDRWPESSRRRSSLRLYIRWRNNLISYCGVSAGRLCSPE